MNPQRKAHERKATSRKKPSTAASAPKRRTTAQTKKSAAFQSRRAKPSGDERPRLQKILAMGGYGSRRQCEELITEGRVEIDRQVVTELGVRVDPESQQVRVDGVSVKLPRFKYFLLHKPVGVISTAKDPWARTRVIDLVADSDRLFTVGRLDVSSSGLILVTNDGNLAHQLTHPSFQVEKVYRVSVAGCPSADTLRQLREGVYLAEGKACVERIIVRKSHATSSELEIVLSEGRNREIRRLLARFGHKVQRLKRLALGPVRLGELPVGAYRELSRQEILGLRRIVKAGDDATAKPSRPGQKRKKSATTISGGRDVVGKKSPAERPRSVSRAGRPKGGKLKATPRTSGASIWPTEPVGKKSRAGRASVIGTVLGAESVETDPFAGEDETQIPRPARADRQSRSRSSKGARSGHQSSRQAQSARPEKGRTDRRAAQGHSGAPKKKAAGRRGGKRR